MNPLFYQRCCGGGQLRVVWNLGGGVKPHGHNTPMVTNVDIIILKNIVLKASRSMSSLFSKYNVIFIGNYEEKMSAFTV